MARRAHDLAEVFETALEGCSAARADGFGWALFVVQPGEIREHRHRARFIADLLMIVSGFAVTLQSVVKFSKLMIANSEIVHGTCQSPEVIYPPEEIACPNERMLGLVGFPEQSVYPGKTEPRLGALFCRRSSGQ